MKNNTLAAAFALAILPSVATGSQLCKHDIDSPSANPVSGRFGAAVAADGPWVAVGVPRFSAPATTLGGSAAVFERSSSTDRLEFVAELAPSDSVTDDQFGFSVALDGDLLAVGARRAENGAGRRGAVYIFERVGGTWSEVQKITSPNPTGSSSYGVSVGLSGDRLVVGQTASLPVEVFRRGAGGVWALEESLSADGSQVGIDGDVISTLSGVFRRDPVFGSWIQEFAFSATSSAVSGQTVFYFEGGAIRIVERDPASGIWVQAGVFGPSLNSVQVRAAGPGMVAFSGQTGGGTVIQRVRVFQDGFPTSSGYGEVKVFEEPEAGVASFGVSAAFAGERLIVGASASSFAGVSSGRIFQYDLRCDPIQAETSCFQSADNSTGATARLDVLGSPSIALNDVTLEASLVPQFTFGIFVTSLTEGLSVMPGGSDGNLCLAGAIGRYVAPGQIVGSGADGRFSLTLDLSQTPTPLSVTTAVPGNRYFQAWHRDLNPSQTSNFTDAVRVVFVP